MTTKTTAARLAEIYFWSTNGRTINNQFRMELKHLGAGPDLLDRLEDDEELFFQEACRMFRESEGSASTAPRWFFVFKDGSAVVASNNTNGFEVLSADRAQHLAVKEPDPDSPTLGLKPKK